MVARLFHTQAAAIWERAVFVARQRADQGHVVPDGIRRLLDQGPDAVNNLSVQGDLAGWLGERRPPEASRLILPAGRARALGPLCANPVWTHAAVSLEAGTQRSADKGFIRIFTVSRDVREGRRVLETHLLFPDLSELVMGLEMGPSFNFRLAAGVIPVCRDAAGQAIGVTVAEDRGSKNRFRVRIGGKKIFQIGFFLVEDGLSGKFLHPILGLNKASRVLTGTVDGFSRPSVRPSGLIPVRHLAPVSMQRVAGPNIDASLIKYHMVLSNGDALDFYVLVKKEKGFVFHPGRAYLNEFYRDDTGLWKEMTTGKQSQGNDGIIRIDGHGYKIRIPLSVGGLRPEEVVFGKITAVLSFPLSTDVVTGDVGTLQGPPASFFNQRLFETARAIPFVLNVYPELSLVTVDGVKAAGFGRPALASDEGLTLLMVMELIERYQVKLPRALREGTDLFLQDLRASLASDSSQSVSVLLEKALSDYEASLREPICSQIPLFERIGVLPELKGKGPRLPAEEVPLKAMAFVATKTLTDPLSRELSDLLEKALGEKRATDSAGRLTKDFWESYLQRFAAYYLKHRDKILDCPDSGKGGEYSDLYTLHAPCLLREIGASSVAEGYYRYALDPESFKGPVKSLRALARVVGVDTLLSVVPSLSGVGGGVRLMHFLCGHPFQGDLQRLVTNTLWDVEAGAMEEFCFQHLEDLLRNQKTPLVYDPEGIAASVNLQNERKFADYWEISPKSPHRLVTYVASVSGENPRVGEVRNAFERELRRANSLILLGAPQAVIAAQLTSRLLFIYEKNRDYLMEIVDHETVVATFPEIQAVTEEDIRVAQTAAFAYNSFQERGIAEKELKKLDMMMRALAVLKKYNYARFMRTTELMRPGWKWIEQPGPKAHPRLIRKSRLVLAYYRQHREETLGRKGGAL